MTKVDTISKGNILTALAKKSLSIAINEKSYRIHRAAIAATATIKISAIAGPYLGVKVADDSKYWAPTPPEVKPFTCGWQVGLVTRIKPISLKIGYEQALLGYYDAAISEQYITADGKPTWPTSKPHSLFVRLGFIF